MVTESLLTFMVPFIFVFAIVFGALEFTEMFKKNKRISGMVALCLAFFAISSELVVSYIYQLMPIAAMAFVALFFLGFVTSMFRGEEKKKDPIFIILAAVFILLFMVTQGYVMLENMFPAISLQAENFMYVGGIFIIIIIFYAAYQVGAKD